MQTVEAQNRQEWRKWLAKNHGSVSEIWLVFYKKHTGITTMSYDAAVEEAICFGWIDSLIRRLDDDRYARKFTPRKENSKWSTANRRRYAKMQSEGLLREPGIARPPTERSGDSPQVSADELPPYITKELKQNPQAWQNFQKLPPSHKRRYIGWIDSAKREVTKEKRLREAIELLTTGRKLGLR